MRQRHSTGPTTTDRSIQTSTCLNSTATAQVLLVLLLVTVRACSTGARRLRQYSINNMMAAMDGAQIDVGHLLFGGPGVPSTPSPQRQYKVNCDYPRPTIVLVPGGHSSSSKSSSSSSSYSCDQAIAAERSQSHNITVPCLTLVARFDMLQPAAHTCTCADLHLNLVVCSIACRDVRIAVGWDSNRHEWLPGIQ
jgi:hypothetical protein